MFLAIILLTVGLVILIKGADFLVDGASSFALKFKIAPIVIGLTIVAFGTSAPELVSSVMSALKGSTGLAFGNVVGSNIMNILVILGVAAIIYPLKVHKNTVWKEIPMSFLGAGLLIVLGLQTLIDSGTLTTLSLTGNTPVGTISFSNGLILIAFFIIFMYYTFGIAKVSGDAGYEIKQLPVKKSLIFIVTGVAALGFGSTLLVDNAVFLAQLFGVSDTLVGLTIIAIGTSMPELMTSIAAARKRQTDIAVGNVVGSNIFNIFLVLGITSLVAPIPIVGKNVFDILVLFGATLFLLFASSYIRSNKINRTEGIIMIVAYCAYMIYIIMRG